jgi:aspartate ammonia-lyase
MPDKLQEYFLFGLMLLLTIIPIIKEIKSKKKSSNIIYIVSIIIIALFLFYLGFNKVDRDDRKSVNTEKKIDTLIKQKKEDSLRFSQFETSLLNKFQIKRDSVTNNPIKIYNTSIQNAETVNIGQD